MNKIRILLVDDDSEDRAFFKEALFEIAPTTYLSTVNDGNDATKFLAECAEPDLPCVIVIDYLMPIMNGPELLDWICSRPKFNGINKIVWSTAYDQIYIDGCLSKGAIEYFKKANNYNGIKEIVQKVLAYCNFHPVFDVMPKA